VRDTCPTVEAPPNFVGRKVISGVSNRHIPPETYRKRTGNRNPESKTPPITRRKRIGDRMNRKTSAKIRKLEN
ncbi:hypothetical protein HID58_069706, partial [Brassica napus]